MLKHQPSLQNTCTNGNPTYLGEKKTVSWDMNTLIGQQNNIYQPMVEPIDEALTTEKEITFTPTCKEHTEAVLGSIRHHEPLNIPFCANFDPDQETSSSM